MQITVQITGLDALVEAINNLRLPIAATPAAEVSEKPAARKNTKATPAPLPELVKFVALAFTVY